PLSIFASRGAFALPVVKAWLLAIIVNANSRNVGRRRSEDLSSFMISSPFRCRNMPGLCFTVLASLGVRSEGYRLYAATQIALLNCEGRPCQTKRPEPR